jgi:hypothetical protein
MRCVCCRERLVCTYDAFDPDPHFTCATCGRAYNIISDFGAEQPLFQVRE